MIIDTNATISYNIDIHGANVIAYEETNQLGDCLVCHSVWIVGKYVHLLSYNLCRLTFLMVYSLDVITPLLQSALVQDSQRLPCLEACPSGHFMQLLMVNSPNIP